MEHHYTEKKEDIIESTHISEITAIFTTANAQIRLYNFMDWLHPSQIIYCDTDSCYFLYDPDNPLHKYPSNDAEGLPSNVSFGSALSQWEDEFKGGWGTEFIGAGAKSYAYIMKEGTIKMKQKGITMDVANRAKITYDKFKELVLNITTKIESVERFQFRWGKHTRDVITTYIKKVY